PEEDELAAGERGERPDGESEAGRSGDHAEDGAAHTVPVVLARGGVDLLRRDRHPVVLEAARACARSASPSWPGSTSAGSVSTRSSMSSGISPKVLSLLAASVRSSNSATSSCPRAYASESTSLTTARSASEARTCPYDRGSALKRDQRGRAFILNTLTPPQRKCLSEVLESAGLDSAGWNPWSCSSSSPCSSELCRRESPAWGSGWSAAP